VPKFSAVRKKWSNGFRKNHLRWEGKSARGLRTKGGLIFRESKARVKEPMHRTTRRERAGRRGEAAGGRKERERPQFRSPRS